jgi:hypothetical protein
MAHLYDVMSREDPLSERDVELYIAHLPRIEALRGEPSALQEILAATGWSEGRLAYVAGKIGAVLLGFLDPDALKARRLPEFALPTPDEEALVLSREPAIARAYAQVTRTRRDAAARDAPPRRAARRRGG